MPSFRVDTTPINTAHTPQHSLFTSAERIARVWLKNCITSLCARKESVIWSAHVSPFVGLALAVHHEHIFSLIHSSLYHDTRTRATIGTTRSTSKTPSTSSTSPRPLWRENLQSGGNPRKTFSTGYEPIELATKELAIVSRISRMTDPYQLYDAQKEFGERDHRRVPITEEVKEFGKFGIR